MLRKKNIICYGELILDMFGDFETGFTSRFGGAPGNVAIGLKRLGSPGVKMIGGVGRDLPGQFLLKKLKKEGVDTAHVGQFSTNPTTIVFVTHDEDKKPTFSFYSDAHAQYGGSCFDYMDFKDTSIIHHCSVCEATNPEATETLCQKAVQSDIFVSYDPNIRMSLWENQNIARESILKTCESANLLKMNDDEALILSGEFRVPNALEALTRRFPHLQLIVVTCGSDGCYFHYQGSIVKMDGIPVSVVDTVGAGDAFNAALLHGISPYISGRSLNAHSSSIHQAIRKALVCSALVCTKAGAVEAFPTSEEVEKYLIQ